MSSMFETLLEAFLLSLRLVRKESSTNKRKGQVESLEDEILNLYVFGMAL